MTATWQVVHFCIDRYWITGNYFISVGTRTDTMR
jgi:hypothetical protein